MSDITSDIIIINGETYRKVRPLATGDVLIRTRSAGVHLGRICSRSGTAVTIEPGSVRIWRWRGANTLNELATRGCDSALQSGYTRISEPSPGVITLTEAIEIIEVTDDASASIRSAGWAK